MARKQTRRTVSLNRSAYEAAKQEADRRGMTLAALVEFSLVAIGVPVDAHPQQPLKLAQANAERRAQSIAARRGGEHAPKRSSSERQILGGHIAASGAV